MADTPEAIRKSIRTYMLVGAVLFGGTILTVMVATQPWLDVGVHGFDTMDCLLGLAIATTKATLVAAIFMHLNHEKKLVYGVFGLGIFLGFCLLAITAFAFSDPIHYQAFFGR